MRRLRAAPPASLGGTPGRCRDRLRLTSGSGGTAAGLPPSDVLRFTVGGDRVVIRPSGTEPKVKAYFEIVEPVPPGGLIATRLTAQRRLAPLREAVSALLSGVATSTRQPGNGSAWRRQGRGKPADRIMWNPAWLKVTWSVPAAMRAVRATIVIPSMFAITSKVIVDPQMALFATFGGFATLVVAGFGGTRKDKLTAHLGLAIAGSVALVIGTLVSGTAWLAAVVTIPVVVRDLLRRGTRPGPGHRDHGDPVRLRAPGRLGGRREPPSAAAWKAGGWCRPRAPSRSCCCPREAPATASGRRRRPWRREIATRVRKASDGEATDPAAMRAAKERLRAALHQRALPPDRPGDRRSGPRERRATARLGRRAGGRRVRRPHRHDAGRRARSASCSGSRRACSTTCAALLGRRLKDAARHPAFEELERARAAAARAPAGPDREQRARRADGRRARRACPGDRGGGPQRRRRRADRRPPRGPGDHRRRAPPLVRHRAPPLAHPGRTFLPPASPHPFSAAWIPPPGCRGWPGPRVS